MTIRELPSSLYYNKLPTLRDFLPRVSFNSDPSQKKSVERFDWCRNDAPIKIFVSESSVSFRTYLKLLRVLEESFSLLLKSSFRSSTPRLDCFVQSNSFVNESTAAVANAAGVTQSNVPPQLVLMTSSIASILKIPEPIPSPPIGVGYVCVPYLNASIIFPLIPAPNRNGVTLSPLITFRQYLCKNLWTKKLFFVLV